MEKTSALRKVGIAIVILLIISYVIYVIGRASFNPVKTESATIMTVSDSISCVGSFIRNEQIISYSGSGVISYVKSDGSKVSAGEAVADIYKDSEQAAATKDVEKIRYQLEQLRQLNDTDEVFSTTPNEIDNSVNELLTKVNLNMIDGDFSSANSNIDNILYNINERHIVTGKIKNFDTRITELEKQEAELKKRIGNNKNSDKINSPVAGYFVSYADGYENQISIEDVEKLTEQDLSEENHKKKAISESVIGKTIKGVYWYIACPVSAEDALKIKNADSLGVDIPTVNSGSIDVELYCVNQKNKNSDGVVILRGSYMSEDMVSLRRDNIEIVLNTYTGIYVSKNAVHQIEFTETVTDENGKETHETKTVSGVYVRVGTEISFKQIVPIYTGNDFIICKMSPNSSELVTDNYSALKVYDDVVVEGANLYDGKIIN